MRNNFSRSAPLVVGKGGVMVADPMPPLISLELPANSNQSLHHRPHTPFADTAGKCWFRLLHFLSAFVRPISTPTTHCQMSIGEYRRGINNPACSESIHVTGWKGNITLEVVKLVTDYYAPCIWILWMLCPLYNMNSLDIMHPVWKYFGYLI